MVKEAEGAPKSAAMAYNVILSDLVPGTTYYYRAFVTYSLNGKTQYVYGNICCFATLCVVECTAPCQATSPPVFPRPSCTLASISETPTAMNSTVASPTLWPDTPSLKLSTQSPLSVPSATNSLRPLAPTDESIGIPVLLPSATGEEEHRSPYPCRWVCNPSFRSFVLV